MSSDKVVARVKRALKQIPLPDGVRDMNIQLGEDATGDPAVWIFFTVDDELKPSKARVGELNHLANAVSSVILRSDIGRFPYVEFRTPAQR